VSGGSSIGALERLSGGTGISWFSEPFSSSRSMSVSAEELSPVTGEFTSGFGVFGIKFSPFDFTFNSTLTKANIMPAVVFAENGFF
jgi:hypothetical protein